MSKAVWLAAIALVAQFLVSCSSADPVASCRQQVREYLDLCLQSANSPKVFLRELCHDEYQEHLQSCP